MKNKKEKQYEYELTLGPYGQCVTLLDLLTELNGLKLNQSDFNNVKFKLDFSCCYYESDIPEMIAKFKIKK